MDIFKILQDELQIGYKQVEAAVRLIDEGNTIPFIARYRKEATGSLNDEVLRNLDERLRYLRNLEEKKNQVLSTIREMNKQYGITVVLITHYMDEAAQCDRVVVVDDGKIILDGTAREVFTHVQLLKSRGLDVPQSTDLANDLADVGYSIDRSILGEEECADALAALLEAHGIHSTKQAEEA